MNKQAKYKILDTFNDFVKYWTIASQKNTAQKLRLWQDVYMSKYPELLEKQIRNYEKEGFDWREIAVGKVFPRLNGYFPLMQEARENLLRICGSTYERTVRLLGINFPIFFVIYVGIGCGAGWATQYKAYPACLLGLEQIAKLGWHTKEKLKSLLAHEIGHLVHMTWRGGIEKSETCEEDPLFILYSEGFAKRCEYFILGKEAWNEANNENWVTWCKEHKRRLAKEYLYRTDSKKPVNDFFGDWLNIQGKKQTGYFLGWNFVLWLEKNHDLRDIATFPFEKVKEKARRYLCHLATDFT